MSSGFPLANHLALPDSESELGVSQDPPMCAHASLSQDGFYRKGLWVVSITYYAVVPLPFLTSFLHIYGWGSLLTLRIRNKQSLLSEQDPAWSLHGPAVFCLGVSVHREPTTAVCLGGWPISYLSSTLWCPPQWVLSGACICHHRHLVLCHLLAALPASWISSPWTSTAPGGDFHTTALTIEPFFHRIGRIIKTMIIIISQLRFICRHCGRHKEGKENWRNVYCLGAPSLLMWVRTDTSQITG